MNDKTIELFKQSYSLKEIASWTSGESEVTIPAIQRGLVWKPNQVELLWDSILRGFPIGSFLLSDVVEEGGKGKYYLMDGQQRYNAISIGFNPVPDNARAVLWIDIEPPEVKDSTRVYWIKATTIPHPWGFKNDDDSTCFNASEKGEALKKLNLKGSIYNTPFSLKDTWPVESTCPIPLYCLINAAYETDNPESFVARACELFQESGFAYRGKAQITDKAKAYVMNRLYKAFSTLKEYRINCNHLPNAVVVDEINNDTDQQTTLEVLFTRLNTGGTQISRDDLNYAAIKAYWPSIKKVNDSLAEKYMNPSKLAMLAFRLALTEEKDKGLKNEISIKQIRGYAKDKEARDKIEGLYNNGVLEKILSRVDDWLGVLPIDDKSRTPAILRTLISWNSPDVYLLLMYFALKDLQTPIALTSAEIRSLAFGLHWFSRDDKRVCVQEIFKNCKNGINRKNIQMALATLMNKLNLLHIYSPGEVKEFIKKGINENTEWRVWNYIPNPAREFFDRIFIYGNCQSPAAEMLLYAEREYINTHFANYDPARQDLWADYNRPWDFDHIVARNRIVGKWGEYREYNKVWLDSIGNMAAISYESNRSKNAGEDFSEYENEDNREALLFDGGIKNIQNIQFNYSKDDSVLFAKVTYDRFCRIYATTYEMFKALFEGTELSDTLQKRKELMEDIAMHYQSKGAIVHFASGDDDYLLVREQDWARAWTGVGIKVEDYMVCFEWDGQMENGKPKNVEVGIRKSLHSNVTKDKKDKLKGLTGKPYEDNPWWYMWDEDCKSIDIDDLIKRMDYYLSVIEEAKEL